MFSDAGRDAGRDFSRALGSGLDDADRDLRKVANTASDSYDKMRDAAGKLRSEEERLKALRDGGAGNDRIVRQAEAVEKARRAEARATRDAASAYDEYEQAASDAGAAGESAGDSFMSGIAGGLSASRLGSIGAGGGAALGAGIVTGVGAALTGLHSAIDSGLQSLQAQDLVRARIGADPQEMARYGQAAAEAYANGFGTSVQDNLSALQFNVQAGLIDEGSSDAAVQDVIEQSQTVAQLLQEDAQAVARGTRNFVKTGLVDSYTEAFDLIVAASQKGLDISGDLLDSAEEYGTAFEAVGLSGADAFGLINQMMEGGIRNTDVAADSIKELAISVNDNSESTRAAFEALGLNADDMAQRFSQGGAVARNALSEVLSRLQSLDEQQRNAVGLNLFKTKWEDAGTAIKNADLDTAASDLGGIEGASKKAAETVAEHANQWDMLGRNINTAFSSLKTWLADNDISQFLASGLNNFFFGRTDPVEDFRNTLPPTDENFAPAGPGDGLLGGPTAEEPPPLGLPGLPGILLDPRVTAPVAPPAPLPQRPPDEPFVEQAPVPLPAGGGTAGGGGGGAASLPEAPVLPQSYTSLPAGTPEAVISAQERIDEAAHGLAEKKARLSQLESVNVATDNDLQKARNDVLEAERDVMDAERSMQDARVKAYESQYKQLNQASSSLGEIGAQLDQDFGISRGLAGIAENLTMFIANLAAAPLLGPLAAIRDAYGGTQGGGGLVGIAGALSGFSSGSGGGGYGQYGMQYFTGTPGGGGAPSEAQVRQIAAQFDLEVTSALRPGDSGYHGQGMALDLSNGGANTPEMEAFARYMAQNFGSSLKELIYTDPDFSGSQIKDGRFTPDSTYGAVAGEHENHVHIAADWGSGGGGMPGGGSGFPWDVVAQFESGNNWGNADTGNNGHYGGLQFSPSTWNAFGGQQFAPMPHLATREQQMAIADNTAFYGYNGTSPQGLGAWEVITNGSTAPYGITTGSQPPGGGGPSGGPMMPGTGFPQAAPFGSGSPFMSGLGDLPVGAGGPDPGSTLIGGIGWPTGGAGGSGAGGGGVLGGLMSAAGGAGGMALDAMAPGAGTATSIATQIAIQEINRAIKYGGQVVGIGVQGLMETFLPVGASETAANSWITRIAGGLAGAAPQLPNMAGGGKKGELMPKQQAELDQGRGPLSPAQAAAHQAGQATNNINSGNQTINVDATDRNTGGEIGRDIQYETNASPVTGP